MTKHYILLSILLLINISSFAKFVNKSEANNIAIIFFAKQFNQINKTQLVNIEVNNTISVNYHNQIVYYIVNIKNHGFVQISADDAAYPILAYDLDHNINDKYKPDNYINWSKSYKKQIEYIRTNQLPPSTRIERLWRELRNSNTSIANGKSIGPLLLSNWNQDALYNAQCPEDVNGPGGRVYAGCVAIAMAQIMYYYRYPLQGTGSHSYYHNVYGTQSADFGNTTYKWSQMTNKISSSGNSQIAKLLYHLGVSVNMNYSASGSGAYSQTAANALKTYFGYQSNVELKDKDDYTYNEWINMITTSLDNKTPLYYHGFDNQSGGGHAFNLDGYQGSDHFHFNWGWGGSYNGYYYLNALNPGSSNFINGQGAIFNIYPASSNYPYSCSVGNIYDSNEGTIEDGSGPHDYENNLNCNWLINPSENIAYIKITFDRFDLMPGDTLFIYDRYINDSLIAAYTSSQTPSPINTVHDACYLNFKTNSTQKGSGFSISYKSYYPIYCSGISYYTDSAAVLSDGSDTNHYNNSTFCRWLIEPSNGYPVRIYFDSFDTEPNKDYVKIYDTDHSPAILLANYSGHNIPPSVYCNSGKMSIIFTSSTGQTFDGWSAHYISGPSVSINDINKSIFKVYPNPTSEYVFIDNLDNNKIDKISVISVDGRVILKKTIDYYQTRYKLKLPNLNQGIFFIKIQSLKHYESQKLIIK